MVRSTADVAGFIDGFGSVEAGMECCLLFRTDQGLSSVLGGREHVLPRRYHGGAEFQALWVIEVGILLITIKRMEAHSFCVVIASLRHLRCNKCGP